MSSWSNSEKFRACIESAEFGPLTDVYAPGALLDATVGAWRFQRQGQEAIVRQFESWYATPARLLRWRELPTDWGVVIEAEESQGDGEAEVYFRYVNLLFTDDDRITQHVCYCSGPWDVATVRRHAAEAPMVRP